MKIKRFGPISVRAKLDLQLWSLELIPAASLNAGETATLTGLVSYPRENRNYVQIMLNGKLYLAWGPHLENNNGT